MKGYIYIITNTITGKQYVGSRMYKGEPLDDKKYMGSSLYLREDYKKYGIEKFKKEIVETYYDKKELIDGESNYILKFGTLYPEGYNRMIPNRFPNFHTGGIKMSEETKKKIGEGNKGKIRSKESKEKIRKTLIGNTRSLGKKRSEEFKRKIKDTLSGRTFSESHKNNLRGKGHPISDKQKKILSEFHKEKTPGNKGISTPEYQKIKMREVWKKRKENGWKISEEQKEKIKNSFKQKRLLKINEINE